MNVLIPPAQLFRLHTKRTRRVQVAAIAALIVCASASKAQVPASAPSLITAATTPVQSPASAVSATSAVKRPVPPKPSPGLTLSTPFAGLEWSTLTPAQQLALRPLNGDWKDLSDAQKRKWISLSANYVQMTASDQAKLHERMAVWAALSPKQREQARLNFAETQKINPQEKSEKWQAYQALSSEDKQNLAKSMRPKPPSTALAAKPVASDKMNRVSVTPVSVPITTPPTPKLLPASAPALPSSQPLTPAQSPTSAPEPAAIHDTAKP